MPLLIPFMPNIRFESASLIELYDDKDTREPSELNWMLVWLSTLPSIPCMGGFLLFTCLSKFLITPDLRKQF